MSKVAIYPGSFNPVTIGHLAIIHKAARLFDAVNVIVADNPAKTYNVSIDQRVQWIKTITADLPNVFTGFLPAGTPLVDAYKDLPHRAQKYIVRGLRNATDFAYEMEQQYYNDILADISHHMETVYLTAQAFNSVSSTNLREVAKLVSYDKFAMAFGWSDATSYKVIPPENLKPYNDILYQVYEAYNGKHK